MAKLTLTPNPTFKHTVMIPVAGQEDAAVEFVMKYRTGSELAALLKETGKEGGKYAEDSQFIADIVSGWDLDEPFTPENLAAFLDNYSMAALAIGNAYYAEAFKAREKN